MPRKKVSLNRRRGTSRGSSTSPFQSSIGLLLCIALSLTIGMVGVFLYSMPDSSSAATSNKKVHLPGVPNLLRGKIEHVVHPEKKSSSSAAAAEKQDKDPIRSEENKQEELEKERKKRQEAHRGAREELRHKLDEELHHVRDVDRAHDLLVHDHLRHHDETTKKKPEKVTVENLDLERYDPPATKDYPYPLEPVKSDYNIATEYAPQGGMRYSEYTTGGTPYRITPELVKKSDQVARSRRPFIKQAMQFTWNNYVKYAFGMDELMPQSGKGDNVWGGQGITLVDALDTLWLMDMKDEFYKARDWVRDKLSHENVGMVSVFETTIRDLGGLLAAYDWSGDEAFLKKAEDLGDRLFHAFDGSSTGIPFGQVNLANGQSQNLRWAANNAIVAEFGTLQIEFRYLAKLTGRKVFADKVEHLYDILKEISPPNGLFPYFVRNNPRNGGTKPEFANNVITFGAMGDSLYEYMLKIWLQGGKTEPMYREMYDKAIDSMHKELLQTSTPSGLTYIADKKGNTLDHKMDHLVCFMGGLLALGAYTDPQGLESERAQRDLRTGKALTYTCYQMYARMNTGISPEYVQFHAGQDFQIGRGAPHYLLRPEAVESFFILNQLTGDPVYREWGWEVFQSIEKYCKTEYAYGSLSNVQDTSGRPRDKMESFFLAELLKYLYLLQDPDTEVDILHKHVFNTEAHPLRIFPVIDTKVS